MKHEKHISPGNLHRSSMIWNNAITGNNYKITVSGFKIRRNRGLLILNLKTFVMKDSILKFGEILITLMAVSVKQVIAMQRLFRYYPEDFGKLPVTVLHMDLTFDVYDDHTRVHSDFIAESREDPLTEVILNAKDLEIKSVSCKEQSVQYAYDAGNSLLTISFENPVPPKTRFTLITDSVCRPTRNILEGLYYDETPPGAPPQQITQCQQWGFQRIVPCIDDMTAKCTYSTTIIADGRYTNLISNGDVVEPVLPSGNGRVRIKYDNSVTPMAPYLFFIGCGTYATFERAFEYPGGNIVTLELLVPPGTDSRIAEEALDILYDAIMWVHLFTGAEAYEQLPIRNKILNLTRERDRLRAGGESPDAIENIREQLRQLSKTAVSGYEYTGSVYREIGMQNSNFGGMENVGNTTISTNRIIPFPDMTDSAYEYMITVKVHEFYHNLNGSEVTGRSPFELWLNEAVTVYIEKMYHGFLFGDDYTRLQTVLTILAPEGTFSLDSGAASMPVEPDGFDDPNDLITDITYVKGPEFVRMIAILMGQPQFMRGLALYYQKYRHGNASRAEWIQAMEEVSGQAFGDMAQTWLKQTGFPTLHVNSSFDEQAGALTLRLNQSGFGAGKPWTFPIEIALVDESGEDIFEQIATIKNTKETILIESPKKPAFISLNRGYTFYGLVVTDADDRALFLQARKDKDIIARFIAFFTLMDHEKLRLLFNPQAQPSDETIDLFFGLLSDGTLMARAGGQFLTVFDSVQDQRYAHRYQALFVVRERFLHAVAVKYENDIRRLHELYRTMTDRAEQKGDRIGAIKARQTKNLCIGLLSRLDTPDVHTLIRSQIEKSGNATDRAVAFSLYLDTRAPDKMKVFERFEEDAKNNPVRWEIFLSACARAGGSDAIDIVRQAERSVGFRIEQANDQRALFVRFALNRKKSLQSPEGRQFLLETLRKLAPVNEYNTVQALHAFGAIDLMEKIYHEPVVHILVNILNELDSSRTPVVYNTIRRLLLGSPVAVRAYEKVHGKIGGISP
jgi:aminopeptidase N